MLFTLLPGRKKNVKNSYPKRPDYIAAKYSDSDSDSDSLRTVKPSYNKVILKPKKSSFAS